MNCADCNRPFKTVEVEVIDIPAHFEPADPTLPPQLQKLPPVLVAETYKTIIDFDEARYQCVMGSDWHCADCHFAHYPYAVEATYHLDAYDIPPQPNFARGKSNGGITNESPS